MALPDKCEVIHLACPDYNARVATAKEAHEELARAYASVLREFAKADGTLLRLAPIGRGGARRQAGGQEPTYMAWSGRGPALACPWPLAPKLAQGWLAVGSWPPAG